MQLFHDHAIHIFSQSLLPHQYALHYDLYYPFQGQDTTLNKRRFFQSLSLVVYLFEDAFILKMAL